MRNKSIMGVFAAVVALIKTCCARANKGDKDAMETCNQLDAAGREQMLFAALEVPDDNLKVLAQKSQDKSFLLSFSKCLTPISAISQELIPQAAESKAVEERLRVRKQVPTHTTPPYPHPHPHPNLPLTFLLPPRPPPDHPTPYPTPLRPTPTPL